MKRALISGGGTGGHIFPALSIANALKRRFPDIEILFVGAQGRMEMERVPEAGYNIIGLPVSGFDRHRPWRNFKVLWRLWRSMRLARKTLRNFRPEIAIGVGGYASGPMLKAAQKAGIPTLIQEQNSYAGVTNKLLAKGAQAICTAYEGMERFFPADKITITGNPVRKTLLTCPLTQLQAKKKLGFDPVRPLIFVTGGSLGARTINKSVAASLQAWTEQGYQVLWQTGKNYIDEYTPLASPFAPDVTASAFISDMAAAYRAADLVVARAGASTISELQLLGKAAVLIPSPMVAEDHQRKNAMALASRDAAVMILDKDAPSDLTQTVIEIMTSPRRLAALSTNVANMALPDADEKIVDCAIAILNNKQ